MSGPAWRKIENFFIKPLKVSVKGVFCIIQEPLLKQPSAGAFGRLEALRRRAC